MNTRVIDSLRRVEIFSGLTDEQLAQVAGICRAARVAADGIVFREGDSGIELFVVLEGGVHVMINTRRPDGSVSLSTINSLYKGQCFGETALLSQAPRSATVVASEPTTLLVLREPDFRALCENDPGIGYRVMRNLAQDLAYKLRSSNLLLHGTIRWQSDELGGA